MRTLLALRLRRMRHRMRRQADRLSVYFDPWSLVHYLFAAAAFGPGIYQYWVHPPVLPAVGLTLLSLWPLLGVVLGWGWALSQGAFGAAAGVPLPFDRADVHLLLTSPVDRRLVVLERFLTGWWRRAAGPVGLVLLFAVLTAGYRAVAFSQIVYLALTLVWLALGALGLSVAIFALGPRVVAFLRSARQVGQILMLLLTVAGFAFGLRSRGGGNLAAPGALPALPALPALDLGGAILPAALFALLAAGLGWLLTNRQDLALWAGAEDDATVRRGQTRTPLPGFSPGNGAFRWKVRAALRKRPLWQWISRFALPAVGAMVVGPLGGSLGGVIGAVMAALALFQAARFLAGPVADELRNLGRLGRLPVTKSDLLRGALTEISLWLLGPTLAVWLLWGAGWLALAGGPVTAIILAILAVQHEWDLFVASLSVGSITGDGQFAYVALTGVILLGHYLIGLQPGFETLLLLGAGTLGGAFLLLIRLHWDLLAWNLR